MITNSSILSLKEGKPTSHTRQMHFIEIQHSSDAENTISAQRKKLQTTVLSSKQFKILCGVNVLSQGNNVIFTLMENSLGIYRIRQRNVSEQNTHDTHEKFSANNFMTIREHVFLNRHNTIDLETFETNKKRVSKFRHSFFTIRRWRNLDNLLSQLKSADDVPLPGSRQKGHRCGRGWEETRCVISSPRIWKAGRTII